MLATDHDETNAAACVQNTEKFVLQPCQCNERYKISVLHMVPLHRNGFA